MRFEEDEMKGGCPDDRRTVWVKPELRRLDAGSAEQGIAGVDDFAMNPS